MEDLTGKTSSAAAVAPPLTAARCWSCVTEAESPTAAAAASHARGSALSRLERIVTGGLPLSGTTGSAVLSELPLLWSAVEASTPTPPATTSASPSAAASARSTPSCAAGGASAAHEGDVRARESAAHARFIRECTGLLWGGDYPAWLEQLWVRDGDAADEDVDVDAEGEGSGGRSRSAETSPASASSTAAGDGTAARPPPSAGAWESSGGSVTRVLQQALDTLHLRLPLQQQPEPQRQPANDAAGRGTADGADGGGGNGGGAGAPVQALATHLVQDAPLLWLRYLLVPMYTQWTQQRHTTAAAAAADTPPTAACETGAVTMHRLLSAVAAAALPAALAKEGVWAQALMDVVTEAQAVPAAPAAWATTRRRLRERRAALQDAQRQHIGEVLYFTGTLARAAQSFLVLGHGGHTLLALLLRRLVGEARASWVEWAGRLTEAQLGDVARRLGGSGADHIATTELKREAAEEDGAVPAGKRPRVEAAAPVDAAADTFASVRVAVRGAAREHARLLWRCWYVLYGFYGADLYTNDTVARALAEDEMEKAGVRRMSSAQQEHWRRLRVAADVKQHALSETHWLWLQCLLAAAAHTMSAALQRAHSRGDSGVEKSDGAAAAVDGVAGLYTSLVRDAVDAFLGELRLTLRVYGEAVLALRTGVLHSGSTAAMPAALQALAHNIAALQGAFARSLAASLACAPSALPSLRRTSGAYVWQLQSTLLRVQAPDEGTWMGTTGGEQAGDGVGAADVAEATAGAFADAFQRHWRQRARLLTDVLAEAHHIMERTVMHGRRRTAMTTPSGHLLAPSATAAAVTPGKSEEDAAEGGAAEGVMMAGLLSALVHRSPAPVDVRCGEGGAVLGDIATDFVAVFDQSCYFVLRPERQRLLTRSVERLHDLLRDSRHAPLLRVLRGDTRLWMLLVHGTLLQLERRGRMAREDEALLVSHLLPLLVLLDSGGSSSSLDGEAQRSAEGSSLRAGAAAAVWADPAVARHIFVLLASGLTTLPWDVDQIALIVQRHSALCQRHGAADTAVAHIASWFAAPDDAARTASSLTSTMPPAPPQQQQPDVGRAPLSPWDTLGSPWRSSAPAAEAAPSHAGHSSGSDGGGAAALAREIASIDAQSRRDRDRRSTVTGPAHAEGEDGAVSPTSSAVAAGTAGLPAATAPPRQADEDAADARLADALTRHGCDAGLPTASLAPAPCALLLVVGAYRTCARALHVLRAALEEQHRMAREDEVGEFVGRAATFCTTDDIAAFRGVLETVQHCVFASAVRPWGLLRLWMGYLQHLFLCVVPRSTATDAGGDGVGSAEAESLVLMPSSWQQRRHVASIFGARVYRTGWRALQHDGEPASQTRLREVLGECLADLALLPYTSDVAPTTQAVLQHTLPHAVLGVLCELLCIPVDEIDAAGNNVGTAPHTSTAAADARGKAVATSFLGLAGLLALLRRLEARVRPGSLQDARLVRLLRCLYEAADAAAVGL